ncbi:hypothetical protein [Pseudomonas moorei]|uniref:hypothetical protein n=1 Tax=Pseudomonas moorei TaxID=395599 RepID=UPI001FF5C4EA|nr:hypothetical protein [Pseudomonas moorei]
MAPKPEAGDNTLVFFAGQSSDLDQSANTQRGHALAGDALEDFNRQITRIAQLCDHGAGQNLDPVSAQPDGLVPLGYLLDRSTYCYWRRRFNEGTCIN